MLVLIKNVLFVEKCHGYISRFDIKWSKKTFRKSAKKKWNESDIIRREQISNLLSLLISEIRFSEIRLNLSDWKDSRWMRSATNAFPSSLEIYRYYGVRRQKRSKGKLLGNFTLTYSVNNNVYCKIFIFKKKRKNIYRAYIPLVISRYLM